METNEPEAAAPTPPDPVSGPSELLFSTLYGELRNLAQRQLRQNGGTSISPTTLLHEAYLGMSGRDLAFESKSRFLAYAARVMRGLIIDFIRERRALKRGSEFHITGLPTDIGPAEEADLAKLSEALDDLAAQDPRLTELVDLRYFCGFTMEEIASQRGVARRTVHRDWEKVKALLFRKLRP